MPLCNVSLPANTLKFLVQIFKIAAFEVYEDLGDDINELFDLEPVEPLNENFAELGL